MQKILQKKMLLGTNNPGKIKEMQDILKSFVGIELITPKEINLNLEVEETGKTYQENAALKANAFSKASGLICLADDSGLEVDALDGAPGLFSARFSPKPGATDKDRRDYLLERLAGFPKPWTARFRAVIAIKLLDGMIYYFEGICEGEIISDERGTNGFGYDPIFYIPDKGLTMAELGDQEKNQISHRGRGIQKAVPVLKNIFIK